MARKPRQCTPGIPMHIVQRGNNRQDVFADSQDRRVYISYLQESMSKFPVNIHAWVLMTNHIHLLCTPLEYEASSKMMQTVSGKYAMYFNKRYKRTGSLWDGRYHSDQICDDEYLLCAYRYIELNPVRAGLVDYPETYPWSSFPCNALGIDDELTLPHELYLSLGNNPEQRRIAYRKLFAEFADNQTDVLRRYFTRHPQWGQTPGLTPPSNGV